MSPAPVDLLFIQGASAGAHEADRLLSDALSQALGLGFRVHFPYMPNEGAPDNDVWKRRISTAAIGKKATTPLRMGFRCVSTSTAHTTGGC